MATKNLIRIESKEKVAELYWRILNMTRAEIMDRLNQRIPMFEECIIFAIVFDAARGKTDTLTSMLNRILGNTKDSIDVKAEVTNKNELDLSKLTKQELESLLKIMEKGNAKS